MKRGLTEAWERDAAERAADVLRVAAGRCAEAGEHEVAKRLRTKADRMTVAVFALALAGCGPEPEVDKVDLASYERGYIAPDIEEAVKVAMENENASISVHPDGYCIQTEAQRKKGTC